MYVYIYNKVSISTYIITYQNSSPSIANKIY